MAKQARVIWVPACFLREWGPYSGFKSGNAEQDINLGPTALSSVEKQAKHLREITPIFFFFIFIFFYDSSLPPLNISQDLANAPESLNNSAHPVNLKSNFPNDPQDLCCSPRCFAVYPLDSCLEAGWAAARRTSCWDTSSFPRLDEKLKVVPSVRRQVEYLVTAEPLLQVSWRSRHPPTGSLGRREAGWDFQQDPLKGICRIHPSPLEWGRLSGTAPNEHAFIPNVVKLVRPPNRQPAFCREKWCRFSAARPAHLQSWLEVVWRLWVHFPAQIKALIKAECKELCHLCCAVRSGFIWFCPCSSVSGPLNHLHA